MILQALYRLAQREGLMEDPDYEPKPVAWLVRVDREGRLVGIQDTRTTPPVEEGKKGKSKPKPVAKRIPVPLQPGRSGTKAPAYFLVDNAKYVFGIPVGGAKFASEKSAETAASFRDGVRQCAEAIGDEGVVAVLRFLETVASGRTEIRISSDCSSNDQFAFVYEPDVDLPVHRRAAVKAYWRKSLHGDAPDRPPMQCLVTGDEFTDVGLFPKIRGVPGANPAEISLVGFDNSSSWSYGLRRNENAPVSPTASLSCARALERLLDPAYPNPERSEETLPRRSLILSANTIVCYWSSAEGTQDFSDFLGGLLTANPDEVRKVYHSIWWGEPVSIDDPSAFYALTLTGSRGRVILRDWFESTVRDVQANLVQHFADLDVVRYNHPPKGKEHPPSFPLNQLLESLADPGEDRRKGIPAALSAEITRAAFSGTLYPLPAMQRALLRYRAEIGNEHEEGLDGYHAREWNDARAAIIKAVLNRQRRITGDRGYEEVREEMDLNNTNSGYLLGRLMAIVEHMQRVALGKQIKATVVDSYFSSASSTPQLVFPLLMRKFEQHASAARRGDDEKTKAGAAWLKGQAGAIMQHLTTFPPFLKPVDQGLFILGYHHQRSWLWTKKELREVVPAGSEEE